MTGIYGHIPIFIKKKDVAKILKKYYSVIFKNEGVISSQSERWPRRG